VDPIFDYVPFKDVYGPAFQDVYRRVPSIEKARNMLGFEPGVDLEQGLAKTIAWARANYASANSRHSSG
jgi:UDP-glucose 4-epimerase